MDSAPGTDATERIPDEAGSREPLRFCLVTTFYPPYHFGGDAVFVQRLARAIAARGHSVDVVHSVDAYRLSRSAPSESNAETQGVRRLPLQTPVPFLSTLLAHQLGSAGLYHRRLQAILDSDRYDVIHFHNISLMGGPEVLCYGDCVKLYTTHEYWLVCSTHVLFKFDREACRSKECLLCTLRARRPPQLWRSTARARRCVARLDRLLVPSRFAMHRHSDDGILATMEVLPHFVPVPREKPQRAEGRDGSFLFVGRLEKLIASPALRSELVGRGRRFALEQWTEEVHLERYLQLVQSLMKQRAASAQPA